MNNVLIAEDDLIIAEFLEETLTNAGFKVCGIASSVAEALELGERHRPDLGVVDLFLANGEYGTEIAAAMRRHGEFGVLYATGDPDHPLLNRAEGEGCITKPYSASSVVSALRIVGARLSDRLTSTLPRGFKLLASSLPPLRGAGDYEGTDNENAPPAQNDCTNITLHVRDAGGRHLAPHVDVEPLGYCSKALLDRGIV